MKGPAASPAIVPIASCLSRGQLGHALKHSRARRYTYLNNAKCGCSSVKKTLWEKEFENGDVLQSPSRRSVHEKDAPLWSPNMSDVLESTFTFSIVRNPFARVLSCYLDKIVLREERGLPLGPGIQLRRQFGLNEDAEIGFPRFLELICKLDESRDDMHWRPQFQNILFNRCKIDFIGKIENYDADMQFILSRIFNSSEEISAGEWAPHKTNASKQILDFFGPKEIELTLRKYEHDFSLFAYSPDPANASGESVSVQSVPSEAFSSYLRGLSALDAGDSASAIEHIKVACALEPKNSDFAIAYRHAREKTSDPANAREEDGSAVEYDGNKPGVLRAYCTSLLRSGKVEDAHAAVAAAIEKHPQAAELKILAANILLVAGNFPAAIDQARAALALDPESINGELVLAQAYSKNGQHDEARSRIESLIAKYPKEAGCRIVASKIMSRAGDIESALKHAHKSAELAPQKSSTMIALGLLQERNGLLEDAANSYAAALDRDPGAAKAAWRLGLLKVMSDEQEAGAELMRKAASLMPHNQGWQNALDRTMKRMRKQQRISAAARQDA